MDGRSASIEIFADDGLIYMTLFIAPTEGSAKGVTWKKEQKSAPAQSDVDKVASGIRWKPQQ